MTFTKHRFEQQDSPADLGSLGIELRRIPQRAWDWAVDAERGASFTQLISDTSEMREGWYWYALVVAGKLAVVHIDFPSGRVVDGQLRLCASFVQMPSKLLSDQLLDLQSMAHEAMTVVSVNADGLDFATPSSLSRLL